VSSRRQNVPSATRNIRRETGTPSRKPEREMIKPRWTGWPVGLHPRVEQA
jgi:hypothetical protein